MSSYYCGESSYYCYEASDDDDYCSRRSSSEDYCASGSHSSSRSRGSIAFFSSYRPPVALDIFCLPVDTRQRRWRCHHRDELHLTDGESYNYNCLAIFPFDAIMAIADVGKVGWADAFGWADAEPT